MISSVPLAISVFLRSRNSAYFPSCNCFSVCCFFPSLQLCEAAFMLFAWLTAFSNWPKWPLSINNIQNNNALRVQHNEQKCIERALESFVACVCCFFAAALFYSDTFNLLRCSVAESVYIVYWLKQQSFCNQSDCIAALCTINRYWSNGWDLIVRQWHTLIVYIVSPSLV